VTPEKRAPGILLYPGFNILHDGSKLSLGRGFVKNTPVLQRDHTLDGVSHLLPKKHLALFSLNFPKLWRCDDCGSDIKLQNIMGTMHLHCNCQAAQVMRVRKIDAKEHGRADFRTFNNYKTYPKVKINSGIKDLGF